MIAVTRYVLPFLVVSLFACGDETSKPASGTATLTDDTGIDFRTGAVKDPGHYKNADFFAVSLGASGMKVATGGDNPTHNRPIVWFRNAGGVYRTYTNLADVPAEAPGGVDHLPSAKTGYGFVLESIDGDYIRGWIQSATTTSVTIEWDRLP